jgi:hypothetical protein
MLPKHIPSAQWGQHGEFQLERKVELRSYISEQGFKTGGVGISRTFGDQAPTLLPVGDLPLLDKRVFSSPTPNI